MLKRTNNPRLISEKYFLWLCSLVEIGGSRHSNIEFGWMLHQKEFVSILPNDDNRCEDGKALRNIFSEQKSDNDSVDLNRPCSMLEMLIGLALRMDYQLYNSERGNRTVKWFWLFVRNLGLDEFEDDDPFIKEKIEHNNEIIDRLLHRQYSRKGDGGIFPLRKTLNDQRQVEIWYQMMEYVSENYIIT